MAKERLSAAHKQPLVLLSSVSAGPPTAAQQPGKYADLYRKNIHSRSLPLCLILFMLLTCVLRVGLGKRNVLNRQTLL